jgi:flagellar hook-basal body complex protein FliE
MDGLSISTANDLLNTGKVTRDIKRDSLHNSDSNSQNNLKFSEMLAKSMNDVNSLQLKANRDMQQLSTGEKDNIAEVMVSAEKAEIALKLMIQVRNKLLDAYNEIMKMQV